MADPLTLRRPEPLDSRRRRGGPQGDAPPVNRRSHGSVLRRGLDDAEDASGHADDPEDEIPIVLRVSAGTRLQMGVFRKNAFEALAETPDWTYFVLGTPEARDAFRELVGEYEGDVDWGHPASWLATLDAIDGIELYGPVDRLGDGLSAEDGPQPVDVVLWPARSAAEARRRLDSVLSLVDGLPGATLVSQDPRPDRMTLRIDVDQEALAAVLDEAFVQRVRPPLRPLVNATDVLDAVVGDPGPPLEAVPLGVVDDLAVTANPLLNRVVRDQRAFPTGWTPSNLSDHGTAVAGLAGYGNFDPLVTGGTLEDGLPVVVARVMHVASNGRTEMAATSATGAVLPHQTIEEAIRWLVADHGVKVVNCSINYTVPADPLVVDVLSYTLDVLARELKIVVVVSSGNRTSIGSQHWLTDYPDYLADDEARVAAPGDAALAVTVGSVAARDVPAGSGAGTGATRTAIARGGEPSPFARRGPVRGSDGNGTAKPEFAAHAGNWAWDHGSAACAIDDFGVAVVVPIPPVDGRLLGVGTGSSYAAPAVAHELGIIAHRHGQAGPNLLRALLAVSARRPAGTSVPRAGEPVHALYGTPSAERVLESGGNRVILIYEGTIDAGTAVLHAIPLPAEFLRGRNRRTVRVALAFDPPVRRTRREYVSGTMRVELVRGMSVGELRDIYSAQPSVAEAEADTGLTRFDLPDTRHRPPGIPGSTLVRSNTLQRRDFEGVNWVAADQETYLVVSHDYAPNTTPAQRRAYDEQDYAVVVELVDETDVTVDLHGAVRSLLQGRARGRGTRS